MDEDPHQHDAVVAEFCALTAASALVAENYLSAHDWDLNRSLDFFYEHPPEGDAGILAAVPGSPPPVASAGVQAMPEGAGGAMFAGYGGTAAAGHAHAGLAGDDEDLERALAASLQQGQPRQRGGAPEARGDQGPIVVHDDDDEADDAAALEALARQRESALEARRAMQQSMEGPTADDMAGPSGDLFGIRGRGFRSMGAGTSHPAPSFPSGSEPRLPNAFLDEPALYLNGAGPGHGLGGLHGAPSLDLPDGINVEEARMLEAAMLGVPYQGRMPDFAREAAEREARGAAGLADVDPSVAEQRLLVSEQDAAYEESLALDRAKQDSIARAEREAAAEARRLKEEARARREAAAAAQRREEEAAAAITRLVQRKRSSLPEEPPAPEPGSLQVMIRTPDGSRRARRFRATDPLQAAFDFVDVSGDGSQVPGSYRLVMQFPRRAFEDGVRGSFADAGITTDSAFFMEPLTS